MAPRIPEGPGKLLTRSGRTWTRVEPSGRVVFAVGKHVGQNIEDVPEAYLHWVLSEAELRPGPAEELALRESACEIVGGASSRSAKQEWTNVCVCHLSFSVPPGVAQIFLEEMARLQTRFPRESQAFECLVLNSVLTPLDGMDV